MKVHDQSGLCQMEMGERTYRRQFLLLNILMIMTGWDALSV
nr:MAG TPA: hypothetical protein [Bacteriophage sp.]